MAVEKKRREQAHLGSLGHRWAEHAAYRAECGTFQSCAMLRICNVVLVWSVPLHLPGSVELVDMIWRLPAFGAQTCAKHSLKG